MFGRITEVRDAYIRPLYWSSLFQGLYSRSGKTSYRKISWSLEAARLEFKLFQSLWKLAGTAAALLPRCLSNFRAIRLLQHPISRLRDFTRFGGKTSYRLVNRGPGNGLSPIRRHAITWHNTDLHGQLNFEHVWWMFHSNTHIFIQEIAFEYVVCKTLTILFRSFVITRNVGQWSTTKPKTPTSGFVTAHGD